MIPTIQWGASRCSWGAALALHRARLLTSGAVVLLLGACGDGTTSRGADGDGSNSSLDIVIDTIAVVQSDAFFGVRPISYDGERLVVLNTRSHEVLVVDVTSGDIRARFGGPGSGPGEFQSMTDGVVLGDSVLVLDGLARRLVLFVSGALARTYSFRQELVGRPTAVGIREDGSLVIAVADDLASRGVGTPERVHRDSVRVYSVTEDGSGVLRWQQILVLAGDEYFIQDWGGGQFLRASPAFASGSLYVVGRERVVVADGRTGWVGIGRLDGTWDSLVDEGSGTPRVPAEAVDRAWEEVELRASRPTVPEEYRESAAAAFAVWGAAPPRPYYRRGSPVADERRVAVQEWQPTGSEPGPWVLFSLDDGSLIGRLELPSNARLTTMDGPFLSMVAEDSLGVESVILARAAWPGGG